MSFSITTPPKDLGSRESCAGPCEVAREGRSRQQAKASLSVMDRNAREVLPFHPCLHPVAHHTIARLHLPVAPTCNTSCGYCEREVSAKSTTIMAPGLAAEVLSPGEALAKTRAFLAEWGTTAVVGIAGPGEPLANEQTLETLKLVRREYPDITLCLCTNGLNLPDRCDELHALGVQHLTVTVNGFDPSVVAHIQPTVSKCGDSYEGERAAEVLIQNQVAGIKAAVRAGMVVKVNCVVVPEINGDCVPHTAQKAKDLGAVIFNPMPLIPRGRFAHMRKPEPEYMHRLRNLCEGIMPVFSLCKQCRADAEGIPGKEVCR